MWSWPKIKEKIIENRTGQVQLYKYSTVQVQVQDQLYRLVGLMNFKKNVNFLKTSYLYMNNYRNYGGFKDEFKI